MMIFSGWTRLSVIEQGKKSKNKNRRILKKVHNNSRLIEK